MSPEEQERVRRNFQRFRDLNPEQREQLRNRWRELTPEQRQKLMERRRAKRPPHGAGPNRGQRPAGQRPPRQPQGRR
jgi:hypothetical protein